jgi:hypothetical protein
MYGYWEELAIWRFGELAKECCLKPNSSWLMLKKSVVPNKL